MEEVKSDEPTPADDLSDLVDLGKVSEETKGGFGMRVLDGGTGWYF